MKRTPYFALVLTSVSLLATGCHRDRAPTTPARAGVVPEHLVPNGCEFQDGAVIRGPTHRKRLALVFTGHEYAEGGETILSELARHDARASFFLTGVFLDNAEFQPLLYRIRQEGHYLGPHSDQHLLYCPWQGPKTNLVSQAEFERDFAANLRKIRRSAGTPALPGYFLPPYEHYNRNIVVWASKFNYITVNFTPGTRSNADYTGELDANFVSSKRILDNIVDREQKDRNGLNGFILLLHIGSGPTRADKFHARFGELLDHLRAKGYEFVTIADLLRK